VILTPRSKAPNLGCSPARVIDVVIYSPRDGSYHRLLLSQLVSHAMHMIEATTPALVRGSQRYTSNALDIEYSIGYPEWPRAILQFEHLIHSSIVYQPGSSISSRDMASLTGRQGRLLGIHCLYTSFFHWGSRLVRHDRGLDWSFVVAFIVLWHAV
jgi:hypothetical protein